MSGKDLDRAHELKRLFEKQLDKVSPKKNHKARIAEASSRMDKLLGPEWRAEITSPGVTVVEISSEKVDTTQDTEEQFGDFFDKVHSQMSEEGMDFKDQELDVEEVEERSESSLKARVLCAVKKALDAI